MHGRLAPLLLAAVLALPPLKFAAGWWPDADVDRSSAAWRARESVLARAQVFVDPPADLDTLDLSTAFNDPSLAVDELTCEYVPKETKATSPKFDCRLDDGTVVKVKYGHTPERMAEVAATRLLAALGFAADRVAFVPRVRCRGCPPFPFQTRRLAEWFFAAPLVDAVSQLTGVREFDWAAVERKFPGHSAEVPHYEGWDWWELEQVDASRGGASRDDLDALRLMAVFLAHWDNKAPNQRLVCRDGDFDGDHPERCGRPLLMIQDVGATFGPGKVVYTGWRTTPIWSGPTGCVVGMESLPYGGAGFRPRPISDAARARIAARLGALRPEQIAQLFRGARFPDPVTGDVGDIGAWVRLFQDKVRDIATRGPCPSTTN